MAHHHPWISTIETTHPVQYLEEGKTFRFQIKPTKKSLYRKKSSQRTNRVQIDKSKKVEYSPIVLYIKEDKLPEWGRIQFQWKVGRFMIQGCLKSRQKIKTTKETNENKTNDTDNINEEIITHVTWKCSHLNELCYINIDKNRIYWFEFSMTPMVQYHRLKYGVQTEQVQHSMFIELQ